MLAKEHCDSLMHALIVVHCPVVLSRTKANTVN